MSQQSRNAFLRSLDPVSLAELERYLEPVELIVGQILYRPGDRVDTVYFPEDCLLSLLTSTATGQSVETTMVGNEGAAGLVEACGSGYIGIEVTTQVHGRALRASSTIVSSMAAREGPFARRAWMLIEFQLGEARQSGLCNALHNVEPRLSRWLLEMSERVGGQTRLPVTQDFMAQMLGVQRTTVNAAASELRSLGLIDYKRGVIEVVDQGGLASHACECRAATKTLRDRLGFGT